MSVIATDSIRLSGVVKAEYEPALGYCRESVIINDSAATLKVGTVLGKVTATGKYKVALSAAGDGSQTPAAIYLADAQGLSHDLVLAAATDTKVIVLARGPAIVSDIGLTLGTGITSATAKAGLAALTPPVLVETGL
jgi:hypothetical protein